MEKVFAVSSEHSTHGLFYAVKEDEGKKIYTISGSWLDLDNLSCYGRYFSTMKYDLIARVSDIKMAMDHNFSDEIDDLLTIEIRKLAQQRLLLEDFESVVYDHFRELVAN